MNSLKRLLAVGVGACMLVALALARSAAEPLITDSGRVVSADGVEIAYRVGGQGDTALVFVHGWSCDGGYWDAQLGHFTDRFLVVTLDLAGHGESGTERRGFTIPSFADDVKAVIEHLGTSRIVLIGHSMGGPVAVQAVDELGGRVLAVVAVDSFETPFEWPDEDGFAAVLAPFEEDFAAATEKMVRSMFPISTDQALVDRIVGDMAAAPPRVGISAFKGALGWSARDRDTTIAALEVPLFNINAAPPAAERPLPAGMAVVSNSGHFIPQVSPERFNALLDGLLLGLISTRH